MSKWSLFFLLVPIGGVALFAAAPYYGLSLPENVSTFGRQIDFLYYLILVVTGVTFIGTNIALVYVLAKFGEDSRPVDKADYIHGSRKLEVLWTVIPAVVLLLLALYQMPAWIEVRFPSSKPDIPPIARVIARQFEWRMIYPGPDNVIDTVDDLHVANELHIVKGQRTLIELTSMDVLHSFFLPHLRVKQDAVPGLAIPVWFDALKSTREFQADDCLLGPSDITDANSLADKLQAAADPVSARLKELLSKETRKEIEDWDPETFLPESTANALRSDLNSILAEETLYTPDRFAKVKLSIGTKTSLAKNPVGALKTLLNRQLLDDAYPIEIRALSRHYDLVCAELCGWGHYKMKGRLFVHDTREDMNAWLAERAAEQEASK